MIQCYLSYICTQENVMLKGGVSGSSLIFIRMLTTQQRLNSFSPIADTGLLEYFNKMQKLFCRMVAKRQATERDIAGKFVTGRLVFIITRVFGDIYRH